MPLPNIKNTVLVAVYFKLTDFLFYEYFKIHKKSIWGMYGKLLKVYRETFFIK